MDIDFNLINEIVTDNENILFNGCFCEEVVRFDMSTRRSKRDFYIQSFNTIIDANRDIINLLRSCQTGETELVERSRKCKSEASRLLDIVFEY